MRVEKPLALGLLTRPAEFRRRYYLSLAALSFCPMGDDAGLLGEVAMWKFLPDALPAGQPLDLCIPKPAAEFLVAGSAFAPGGQPVSSLTVSVRLGEVTRRIGVVGDHHVEDGLPSEPQPFTEMPLGWDRAYGGPRFPENPLGRGIAEVPIPGVGHRVALPNVVQPHGTAAGGRPDPVNLGPVDISWPQRARLAGTHDQRWLEEDFPGFARDTDFRMAMAAQPGQRFPGFLAGDEDYAIGHMHPEEPEITGRLPGIQPRILVQRKDAAAFEDVPLLLTTVWFFPARKRLVMVHHGRVQTAEEDARDIAALVLGADRLGAPRPAAAFEAAFAARRDPDRGTIATLDESLLVPPGFLRPDPALEDMRRRLNEDGIAQRRGHARAQREYERGRARLLERGLDPDRFGPPPPAAPEPLPALEEVPAFLAAKVKEAEEKAKEAQARGAREQDGTEARIAAAGGAPLPRDARPAGPPRLDHAAERARLEESLAAAEARGEDASALRAMLDDPERTKYAPQVTEAQRRGYLLSADQQDPAPRLDPEANAALRARLMDGSRGGPRLDLCGADLTGLDLAGFDLTEAWLDGADLRGANLKGARLPQSVLAHARLDGANLAGADLDGANIGRAVFGGADLTGARLRNAVLRGADLRAACLRRADLTGAQFMDVMLEGADLGEATAPRLFVNEASLAGLRAAGAVLPGAVFIKAALDDVDFTGADLSDASFISARGERACFREARLGKAVFVQDCVLPGARFAGARCEGANLRGAALDGASFDGAVLDEADFSDANLRGASFDLARARRARFAVADLREARLTRADFAGAILARADLRGADLGDSSLYEADVARIRGDAATRFERIQQTRMRIHPRRTPE